MGYQAAITLGIPKIQAGCEDFLLKIKLKQKDKTKLQQFEIMAELYLFKDEFFCYHS